MTDELNSPEGVSQEGPRSRPRADLLRELLDFAPFPYLAVGRHGSIVYANRDACELLGTHPDVVSGMPLVGFIDRAEANGFLDWLLQRRRMLEPDHRVTFHTRKRRLPVRLITRSVADDRGEPLMLIALHDLREMGTIERRLDAATAQLEQRVAERNRELAEANDRLRHKIDECGVLELELRHRMQELSDADRAKDEFLALLAHELRNPLAPIRNAVEVIRQPHLDAATLGWAREVIERQVEHLRRLVDDLLDLARVSRGKIELRCRRMDLIEAVDRAVELCWPAIVARRHRLERQFPPEPLTIDGDLERLAQAIANVLNNAVKYTDSGGIIQIHAGRDADHVRLVVRDSGRGIDQSLLPKVFEPFTQGDHSLDRAQGGLGIGLALVKRLVELHGGKVVARNAANGHGAEFELCLPARAAVAEPVPSAPVGPAARVRPLRVLVVEDNVDSAETLTMLLQLHGHDTRVAFDGAEALKVAADFHPDAMLLDIGLPDMSGRELVGHFRDRAETAGALIVAVTGYGSDRDIEASHAAGFDQHLVKPVDPAALEAALATRSAR